MSSREVRVSVIIPTYHDWERLQLCLDALAAQTFRADRFEIIVANNDPGDPAPEGLRLPDNARMIAVASPGSYAARNAALDLARGEILAFTDADCIPEPQWIAAAVALFDARPEVDRIAGRVTLFTANGRWSAAALYDRTYMLRQDVYARSGKAATANAFARRTVFDAVGPFNAGALSGGDHEWSLRAKDAGFQLAYSEQAGIAHPARDSIGQIMRKARRIGGGAISAQRVRQARVIIPHFDKLLPPVRRGILLMRSKELTKVDAFRVWWVLYVLRVATVIEQVRLSMFRTRAERR